MPCDRKHVLNAPLRRSRHLHEFPLKIVRQLLHNGDLGHGACSCDRPRVGIPGGIFIRVIKDFLDHHRHIAPGGVHHVLKDLLNPLQRRYLSIFYMPCGTFPGDLSDQLLLCPEEKISKQRRNISLLRRPNLRCHRLHHPPLCSLGRKSPPWDPACCGNPSRTFLSRLRLLHP